MALTLLIPVGALIGHFYEKWAKRTSSPAFAERMGVLAATGLIVGESLFGVVFAGIVGVTGKDAPLAIVGKNFETIAMVAAPLAFAGLIWLLYSRTRAMAK
jgi:glycerol-3-phosphate acyltransferase PlsY